MRLTAGERLDPHEAVTPIDEGRVGEIYRAHNSRLNCDVAIKILPKGLRRRHQLRWLASFQIMTGVFDAGR